MLPNGLSGSKDAVDGVEIVAREKAVDTPPRGGDPTIIKTVDRVILTDEREFFQCVYPGVECWRAFESAKSAVSHQSTHGRKHVIKKLTTLEEKQKAESTRRSNGIREGKIVRQARIDAIETLTLSEAMRQEADKCEERALWLRSMAAVAAKLEREARGGASVSAQELEALRADATAFHQLKEIFGK